MVFGEYKMKELFTIGIGALFMNAIFLLLVIKKDSFYLLQSLDEIIDVLKLLNHLLIFEVLVFVLWSLWTYA